MFRVYKVNQYKLLKNPKQHANSIAHTKIYLDEKDRPPPVTWKCDEKRWHLGLWLRPVQGCFSDQGLFCFSSLTSNEVFALSWIQACTGLLFSCTQTKISCSFRHFALSSAVHLIVWLSFFLSFLKASFDHLTACSTFSAHQCLQNKIKPSKLVASREYFPPPQGASLTSFHLLSISIFTAMKPLSGSWDERANTISVT